MGSPIDNLKQQAIQQGKQAAKKAVKQASKAALKAIWGIIAPYAVPVIAVLAGIIILIAIIGSWVGGDAEASTETNGINVPTSWWWPIGSEETTKENEKLFASGEPVATVITSNYGPRWGTQHNGIDIAPTNGGTPPGPYIIASRDGTVTHAEDGYENNGDLNNNDGGGLGNNIIIDYGDGIVFTYGHLSKGTIKVKANDTVTYGQVIAQMGHSGQSTGMHLHLRVDKNGQPVDPQEYVSLNDSRPVSQSSFMDSSTSLVDYLLNFGGDISIYQIDGREYYKSYNDGKGNLTVGFDVFIAGRKSGFSLPGYVSDSKDGPQKKVNNVYDYVISKFNSGIAVYIEKELCDSNASEIIDSKMSCVDSLEKTLGTQFSTQQRYALCAIYYRRGIY